MIEVKLLKLYKKKKKLENKKKVKKEAWIFQRIIFTKIVFEKKVTVKNFGTLNILYMTKERTAVRFRVKNNFIEKVNNCNLSDETGMK